MALKELGYQTEALQELKKHFYKLLARELHLRGSGSVQNKIILEAPTGSGKTVMVARFLREVAGELPNRFELPAESKQVVYVWIAPNQLHVQSFLNLKNFFAETRDIDTLRWEDISEPELKPNQMIFLNWQSISRDENLIMRPNERGRTLESLLNRSRLNSRIVVIIDEEHLMASMGEKAQAVLQKIGEHIQLRVSATPSRDSKLTAFATVRIDRDDVVKEEMIKRGVELNPDVRAHEQNGRDADLVLLDKALAKRAALAAQYREAGTRINPLLLIQLPSDKKTVSAEDHKIRDLVAAHLENLENPISEQNGKLAIWLSGEKSNLEQISHEDDLVEVMLFKQAIATGWDCPRASVLLIYRELKQETFTIQTLGRILRMPQQKHYHNDLDIGYVYTNLNKNLIQILPEEADYLTTNVAERNPDIAYAAVNLPNHYQQVKVDRRRIGLEFRQALFEAAEQCFGLQKTTPTWSYEQNLHEIKERGVLMNVEKIDIPIPTDVHLDITQIGETRAGNIEHFAKTTYQIEKLFDRFCLGQCGDYQKDGSWERIKYHTKLLFEDYFAFDELKCYKATLHNTQSFNDLYTLAREKYAQIMAAKASSKAIDIRPTDKTWEVPESREYNNLYVEWPQPKHALAPLYVRDRGNGKLCDSGNEARFIEFLAKFEHKLAWWYKNGTSNQKDFAIPYPEEQPKHLFYVDIIVQFSEGTLGLFDPKTIESHPDNVVKHNALVKFIEERNRRGQKTIGGILIEKDGSWRFCRNRIQNDSDLTGWEIFNPDLKPTT